MQLIYGGKISQSSPRFKFLEPVSLSVNPEHFSNKEEPIKIINEIVLPYLNKQREKLGNRGQATLLILNAFRGQMTQEVTTLLHETTFFGHRSKQYHPSFSGTQPHRKGSL